MSRALIVALVSGAIAVACTEAPQEAGKVYAGKEDQKAYAGDKFKGDKALWEQTLAARADNMNEYVRESVRNRPKN
jgi:hypothetical protein